MLDESDVYYRTKLGFTLGFSNEIGGQVKIRVRISCRTVEIKKKFKKS